MRRLLPLALLLVACDRPTEAPAPPIAASSKDASTDITPEGIAKAADVPMYPGAEAPESMSAMPQKEKDGSTHYSLVLATPDSLEKVATWYAIRLKISPKLMGGGQSFVGKTPGGNDLLMSVANEAGRTLIRIKSIAYAK